MSSTLVSVCMITYGHERFIAQAIEGVLMQECDFDVELIIADDCSPDNTKKVVENFIINHPRGHWIKYTRHIVNKGVSDNFGFAINQCIGKYIAICEGDDYWTDKDKLQIQVNTLEQNRDAVLCYHDFFKLQNGELNKDHSVGRDFTLKDYLSGRYMTMPKTCTILLLNSASIISVFNQSLEKYDTTLVVSALLEDYKKAIYLPLNKAAYRIHDGGVWSSEKSHKKLIHTLKVLRAIAILCKKKSDNLKIVCSCFDVSISLHRKLNKKDGDNYLKFAVEILFKYELISIGDFLKIRNNLMYLKRIILLSMHIVGFR